MNVVSPSPKTVVITIWQFSKEENLQQNIPFSKNYVAFWWFLPQKID
jgi:hypothetical protein